MWLFLPHLGFFSVVLARQGKGDPGAALDPNRVMIRARIRKHLATLKRRFPAIADVPILESRNADYRYRILLDKKVWVDLMPGLAEDIQYPNFKAAAAEAQGRDDPYVNALTRVWSAMHAIQS